MIDVEYTFFIARRRNQECRLAERTCLLITRNFMLHENTNDTNSCQNVAPVISFPFFFFFFNTPISNHFTAANFGLANACCIHSRGSCDTRNRLNETSIPNKLGPKRVSLGPSTITTSQLPPPGEQRIRHSSTPCMLQTRLARQLQLESGGYAGAAVLRPHLTRPVGLSRAHSVRSRPEAH